MGIQISQVFGCFLWDFKLETKEIRSLPRTLCNREYVKSIAQEVEHREIKSCTQLTFQWEMFQCQAVAFAVLVLRLCKNLVFDDIFF